jgi:hypothetical protein
VPPSRNHLSTASLSIIRITLLSGVLLFGGIIWFLHRQPGWAPASEADPELTRLLVQAASLMSLLGVTIVYALHRRARTVERLDTLSIAGWTLGELPALIGGVHYYFTDDPQWYLWGMMALLLTYLIFPARDRG